MRWDARIGLTRLDEMQGAGEKRDEPYCLLRRMSIATHNAAVCQTRKSYRKMYMPRCIAGYKKSRGFSIVEALISIAILATALTIVVSVVINLTQGQGRIRIARRLDSAAVIAMERLTRAIRNASSFDLAQSTFDTHPGKLSVVATLGAVSTTTTVYLSGPTLMLDQNGVTEGPLSAAEVSVDSLIFRRIVTPVSQGVRIEMQLSSAYGTTVGKVALYSTVFARGSYQ